MIGIYFLLSLFLLVKGKSIENSSSSVFLSEECGTTRFGDTAVRIINGQQARLGEFPWMARIGMLQQRGNRKMFFCGGSLISKYYVISAAHCRDVPIHIVRLGENYVRTEEDCDSSGVCAPPYQDIKVKEVKEPNFCLSDMTNDIALIELESPAEYNDFVKPICLPKDFLRNSELNEGHVIISGWGLIQAKPDIPAENLMYITAPLLPHSRCNRIFTTSLIDSQLCIGYQSGKDSCGGDSGGPVVKMMKDKKGQRRAHLIALVSYGLVKCGQGPAVYTYIPSFLYWVLENINKG